MRLLCLDSRRRKRGRESERSQRRPAVSVYRSVRDWLISIVIHSHLRVSFSGYPPRHSISQIHSLFRVYTSHFFIPRLPIPNPGCSVGFYYCRTLGRLSPAFGLFPLCLRRQQPSSNILITLGPSYALSLRSACTTSSYYGACNGVLLTIYFTTFSLSFIIINATMTLLAAEPSTH